MPNKKKWVYQFGPFRLDPQRYRLYRNSEPVPLARKDFDILLLLVRNQGRTLSREELFQGVWGDAFVEDANLTVAISHLRKALGQGGHSENYIETVPRAGYCFTAAVRQVNEEQPLFVEKLTLATTVIEEELIADEPASTTSRNSASSLSPSLFKRIPAARISRGTIVTLIFLPFVFGGFLYFFRGVGGTSPGPRTSSPINSLAVIPPRTVDTQADNASLSLGIANSLITKFASLHRFTVRPITSTSSYMRSSEDPFVIGRKLNVDVILDGELKCDGERIRVSARLLNVRTGQPIWENVFEDRRQGLSSLENKLSREMASALSLHLNAREESALAKRLTANHDAYAAYLEANYYWNLRGHFVVKSIPYYNKAIELDPGFAEAYVELANVNATAAHWTEAKALVEKALELNAGLAEAHATRGFISMFRQWQWDEAEKAFNRALELDPNSSHAHHWRGVYLSLRGRLDEAMQEMHRALELDPVSLIITADIGQLYYFAHDYDRAIEYCNRALALDAEFQMANVYLVDIYLMKGMEKEAFDHWCRLNYIDVDDTGKRFKKFFERGGWQGLRHQELNQPHNPRDPRIGEVNHLQKARLHLAQGNAEQALRHLERAYQERAFMLPFLNVDPWYDRVREHPRFKNIIRSMGL